MASEDLEAAVGRRRFAVRRRPLFMFFIAVMGVYALVFVWWLGSDLNPYNTYMDKTDFSGADLDVRWNVPDTKECYHECEQHYKCVAFTFVKEEGACWLKGAGYTKKRKTGATSGRLNASMVKEKESHNYTSPFGDEPYFNPSDTYNDEYKDPYDDDQANRLGDEEEDGDEDYDDYRSSFDEDWDSPEERRNRTAVVHQRYTTYFGDVRLLANVYSMRDCERGCKEEAGCLAWTLNRQAAVCLLRLHGERMVQYEPDSTAGFMSAQDIEERYARLKNESKEMEESYSSAGVAPPNLGKSEKDPYHGPPLTLTVPFLPFADENTDYVGADLEQVENINAADDCNALCQNSAQCTAWTLKKATLSCSLKSNGFLIRNASVKTISSRLNNTAEWHRRGGQMGKIEVTTKAPYVKATTRAGLKANSGEDHDDAVGQHDSDTWPTED